MGERTVAQEALFYSFSVERHVPDDRMLRSIDPEFPIQMLIVGYCMSIRSERRLCEGAHLNLAYRSSSSWVSLQSRVTFQWKSTWEHLWGENIQSIILSFKYNAIKFPTTTRMKDNGDAPGSSTIHRHLTTPPGSKGTAVR